jgi:uncharacterized protein (DUF2249 family)
MRKYLLFIVLLLVFGSSKAQLTNAEFFGKIKNQRGEMVVDAQIKLIYTPSAIKYKLTTDQKGNFKANNIEVGGPYVLRVEVPGYRVYEKRQLFFDLGSNDDINIVLEEYKEDNAPALIK